MSASPFTVRALRALALTASTLALGTAATQPARAQQATPNSYNAGAPTTSSGNVLTDFNTANTDIYTVTTPTAVINFTPTDTATNAGAVIDFQNAGTQAIYQSTPGGPDFTVLNRIVPADPSRPIAFNGQVTSQLVSAGNVVSRGGSVWFYSPGGIVIGDGSVFDVGSLLLSTADPTGGTGTINFTSGFTLDSSASPNGIVNVLSQATINATNANSYVAIVAPIVFSRGRINVNGAAAFVAAEQASLTFNQGLFDINVAVGTDGTNGGGFPLQLRGTVNLDKSSGAATNNRGIYAVTVPKNDAISMVVAPDGFYGFDIANGVSITNGGVYLVSGGNLAVDPVSVGLPARGQIRDLPTIFNAGIIVQDNPTGTSNFNAPFVARAGGGIQVSNAFHDLNFAGDAAFFGGTRSAIDINVGTMRVGGRLDAFSFGPNVPGLVRVNANGGSIDVTGDFYAQANAVDNVPYTTSIFPFNQGGDAQISAAGGATLRAANITVSAAGVADTFSSTLPALGGRAAIVADGGATIQANGNISVYAGATTGSPPFASVAATGGTASIELASGAIRSGGIISVAANAASTGNGLATGGAATVMVGSGGVLTATDSLRLNAQALGGSVLIAAGSGGAAIGGSAVLATVVTGGPVPSIATGGLQLLAGAAGGTGGSGASSAGGDATGGLATIDLATGSTLTSGFTVLSTLTTGGPAAGGGPAGNATMISAPFGNASFTSAGNATLAGLILTANADGGEKTAGTGNAGNAMSGTARIFLSDGSLSVGTPADTNANVSVSAIATGGSVIAGSGSGGYGIAGGATSGIGSARISVLNTASLSIGGSFSLEASAAGGAGRGAGGGGLAQSSTATALLQSDGAVRIGSLSILSEASGGIAPDGIGGDAVTGLAEFVSAPSQGAATAATIVRQFLMSTNATGGDGMTGGAAQASLIRLFQSGSQATTIGGLGTLTAIGRGGTATGADAGAAQGGQIRVESDNSSLAFAGSLVANADATGGFISGSAVFSGGSALGGSVELLGSRGALSVAGTASLTADALSGSGILSAGDAVGGEVNVVSYAGSVMLPGSVVLSATAFAGVTTGNGGDATAGTIRVVSETDPDSGSSGGSVTTAALAINLNANASQLQDQGKIGGAATGGTFTLLADTGAVTVGDLSAGASANGYGGSDPTTTTMRGGNVLIEARGANLTIGSGIVFALGQAATVFNAQPPAGPGDSIGGAITLRAGVGRTLTITNNLTGAVDALSGRSGLNVQAGAGIGGQITIDAAGTFIAGGLALGASGFGGNTFGFSTATAGDGRGGTIALGVTGLLDVANGIGMTVGGRGGSVQSNSGTDGAGYGGIATIAATQGGVIRAGAISVDTSANAGAGATVAGTSTFDVISGNATLGTYTVFNAGATLSPGGPSRLLVRGGVIAADTLTVDAVGDFELTTGAGGAMNLGGATLRATRSIVYGEGTPPSNDPGALSVTRDLYADVGGDYRLSGNVSVGGDYSVNAGGLISTQGIQAGGSVGLTAVGNVTTAQIGVSGVAGASAVSGNTGVVALASRTGSITTGSLGGNNILLLAPQAVSTGPLASGILANGTILISNISLAATTGFDFLPPGSTFDLNRAYTGLGSSVPIRLGGALNVGGTIVSGNFRVAATGGFATMDSLDASTSILIDSGTTIALADVDTPASLSLRADGGITAGALSAQNVSLVSGANIITGTITSAKEVSAQSGARLETGAIQAGGNVALAANGDIALGNVTGIDIDIDGTDLSNGPYGNITTGNLLGEYIELQSGGTARIGNVVTREIASGGAAPGNPYAVEFGAAGDLTVGTITSGGLTALASLSGNVTAGAITTPSSLVVLAPGNVRLQGVATGATQTALFGNVSLLQNSPALAAILADNEPAFTTALLGTIAPPRIGGALAIAGPVSTGNLLVAATGGIVTDAIDARTRIAIDSGTAIAIGDVTTPASLTLQADGAITTGALSAQNVSLTSNGANVTTGTITSATDILAVSRATLVSTGNIQAGGNVALLARSGITTGGIAARRASGGYVLIADAANASAIDVDAVGTAMPGPVTVGGPISAGALRVSATGTATFAGPIDAARFARVLAGDIALAGSVISPDLAFSSGNIRLGANALIGDAATQTASFTATGGGPAFLGSTTDGSGYTLDAGELSRVRAANIVFTAGPSLAVRDLSIAGTGVGAAANLTGANGALTLASPGTITVTGNLRLADAGAAQSLVLNAGVVQLVTDSGSIGVFTGSAPAGRLAITAGRIEAGTAQLLGGIASFAGAISADTIAAIGAAAAQPRAEGAIQAGRIELSAIDDIVIQNMGSATLAAGFSAGAGGLSITNLRGTQASDGFNVLIYGRIQGDSGFLTNTDTLGAVRFGSAQGGALAGYSTRSVVNGCAFVLSNSCVVTPSVTPPADPVAAPPIAAIVRDVIDGSFITFSRDTVMLPTFTQPAAIDMTILQSPAIVIDPVASAGNPILWQSAGGLTSSAPAGPATGKKQDDDDRRRNRKRTEQQP